MINQHIFMNIMVSLGNNKRYHCLFAITMIDFDHGAIDNYYEDVKRIDFITLRRFLYQNG